VPKYLIGTLAATIAIMAACAAAQAHETARPLDFGMNVAEAEDALGVTLNYISGRRGDELYLALPSIKGSALAFRSDGLYLQFRKGRLTGWRGDWGTMRPSWGYVRP
jgi:hypothetical protein